MLARNKNIVRKNQLFILLFNMQGRVLELGKKPGELRVALRFLRHQFAFPEPMTAWEFIEGLDALPSGLPESVQRTALMSIDGVDTHFAETTRHHAIEVAEHADDGERTLSRTKESFKRRESSTQPDNLSPWNALHEFSWRIGKSSPCQLNLDPRRQQPIPSRLLIPCNRRPQFRKHFLLDQAAEGVPHVLIPCRMRHQHRWVTPPLVA